MASDVRFAVASRNAMLDALNAVLGSGGFLRIYDGTRPTNGDTALGSQVKLAELPLSATPFGAAASGTINANAISDDSAADATGGATWASFVTSAGVRKWDVNVGATGSGQDIELNTTSIVAGARVSVTGYSLTLAAV